MRMRIAGVGSTLPLGWKVAGSALIAGALALAAATAVQR